MILRPFFTYFGGKYRAAPHYPAPRFDTIVEPFAGAAGYSLRYADRKVVLIDKDPVIAGLWRYLVHVSASEIMRLPTQVDHVDSLTVPQEAKWLIGFWLNKGTTAPCKTPGRWMRDGTRPHSFWGETVRGRIAAQVDGIRHWRVIEGSYADAAVSGPATWFVDPPYADSGVKYRESSRAIDFAHLAAWCRHRLGQVLVCEEAGAAWLPFKPFRAIKGGEGRRGGKVSHEVIWMNDPITEDPDLLSLLA